MARVLAWCGGALFLASLVLTGWWYFIELGRPDLIAQTGATAAWLWNAALVTVFAGHHSVFAREAVRRRLTIIPSHMQRSFYVAIASVLLILVVVLWRPIGGELYDNRGTPWVHAPIVLLGFYLIARAVAGLDPLELAGIRQASQSELQAQPLLRRGVYGFVRHPLYLGWIVAFFGVAHMTVDRFAFALLTSAYLVVAVSWEERSLKAAFGEAYADYARQVRWRIVPFIY